MTWHNRAMARKAIEIDPDWPAWKAELAGAMNDAGVSMRWLSEKAGMNETYVRDMLKRHREPGAQKLEAIWSILEGLGSPRAKTDIQVTANGLIVVGTVAAGLWREEDLKVEPRKLPVLPHPDYPADAQRLYSVEGTSINRVVREGAYIHTVDVLESGAEPKPGDLVVVQRRRHGVTEYTAKRLIVEDGKQILRPESDDPLWQADIVLNGDDDTEIVISDIVLAEWMPLRPA